MLVVPAVLLYSQAGLSVAVYWMFFGGLDLEKSFSCTFYSQAHTHTHTQTPTETHKYTQPTQVHTLLEPRYSCPGCKTRVKTLKLTPCDVHLSALL